MNDRELYQQKRQAQLDEWKAEVARLKAKASMASADEQLKMNKRIKDLEHGIDERRTELSELAEASEDAWESLRDGVDSAWDSLKSAVGDAAAAFKRD